MPIFLARALLLLAAAFSLRLIGRRLDREGRARARRPAEGEKDRRNGAGELRAGSCNLPGSQPGGENGTVFVTVDERASAANQDERPDGARSSAAIAPAFASYGGSGVVAGVLIETDPPQSAPSVRTGVPLAAPHGHGRTPSPEERAGLAEDPLAAKHDSEALDFKTVDYGNAKAAERMAATASSLSDGWTVPVEVEAGGRAVPEESLAAFKSVGGAGAVHGAPDGDALAAASKGEKSASETSAERTDDVLAEPDTAAASRSTPDGDGPPLGPDDLTRIDGIGPSIERLLFDNGVFRFADIAAWTPVEINWADTLTGFPGRVDREQWVEQARRLSEAEREG
jgi:predicted flap endonuclease-1-like 5' DNA nuclease